MATEKNILETEVKLTGLTESEKRLDAYYRKLIQTSEREKKFAGDANFADHQKKIAGVDAAQGKLNQTLKNGAAAVSAFIAGGALIAFLDKTIEKSREAATANRLLTSSATEAGLAYAELAAKNKEYADLAGVSDVKAAQTTAKLSQLATTAGRTADISANNKKILDLAAARGIGGADIENLAGQLLSGQDEALNRLGISDPSKLYAQFAAETGRTVDSLSNMEQTAIRLDAVLKKGEIFSGAAERRLKSLDGQLDTTAATLENLTSGFAQNITNTLEFRDALNLVSTAMQGISVDADELKKKLADGLTPEQIAKEATGGAGVQAFDALKGALSGILAPGLIPYDIATGGTDIAKRRFNETLFGANERRRADLEEQLNNQKVLDDLQKQAAAEQRILNLRKQREAVLLSEVNNLSKSGAALDVIENKIKDLLNLETSGKSFGNLFQSVTDGAALQALQIASEARNKRVLGDQTEKVAELLRDGTPTFKAIADERAELFRASAYLSDKDYQNLDRQLTDFVKKSVDGAKKEIEKLGNETDKFFADLFQQTNRENPFVKIFTDADAAIERTRLATAALSDDLQNAALNAQKAINADALFSAQITNDLKVFDLEQIAEKFGKRQPDGGAARFSPEQIDEIVSGRSGGYSRAFDGAFLRNNRAGGFDNLTDADKKQIFENSLLSALPQTGAFSELNRNSLLTTLANNRQKAETGDISAGASVAERFDKQLEILRRRETTTDAQKSEIDRRILALGANLDPSQITDRGRLEIAAAAERQARETANAENAARAAIVGNLPNLQSIDKNIAELLKIAQTDGLTGVIRIINDAGENVRSELGKRPTANAGNSLFD